MKLAAFSPSAPSAALTKSAAADGSSMKTTIVDMLFCLSNLRIAHWQASTKTNEHKALGGLYEALDGLVDDFTEILMGRYRNREMPSKSDTVKGGDGYENVIASLRKCAESLSEDANTAKAPDLQNLAADMIDALNKADYFLHP
jgi:hypothetical protein